MVEDSIMKNPDYCKTRPQILDRSVFCCTETHHDPEGNTAANLTSYNDKKILIFKDIVQRTPA